jgi:TAP-like protein
MLARAAQGDPTAFGAALPTAAPPVDPMLVTGKVGLFRGVLCADVGPQHDYASLAHANVLVTNNTHDPATPLILALSVGAQIPGAHLLIADADGHQALAFSRCAFDNQVQFLHDPASTPGLTVCGARRAEPPARLACARARRGASLGQRGHAVHPGRHRRV